MDSPYKTVQVNNFNMLHAMAAGSTWRKVRCLQGNTGQVPQPALLCRDYQVFRNTSRYRVASGLGMSILYLTIPSINFVVTVHGVLRLLSSKLFMDSYFSNIDMRILQHKRISIAY